MERSRVFDELLGSPFVMRVREVPAEMKGAWRPIFMDCRSLRSYEAFYQLAHTELKFPNYCHKNFNSLDECMRDVFLDETGSYYFLFEHFELFLIEESDEVYRIVLGIFGDMLNSWNAAVSEGEWWDRSPVPLRFIVVGEH